MSESDLSPYLSDSSLVLDSLQREHVHLGTILSGHRHDGLVYAVVVEVEDHDNCEEVELNQEDVGELLEAVQDNFRSLEETPLVVKWVEKT